MDLVLVFKCVNKDEALYLEKFIKKMKSGKFTQRVISSPSILNEILSKK